MSLSASILSIISKLRILSLMILHFYFLYSASTLNVTGYGTTDLGFSTRLQVYYHTPPPTGSGAKS